MCDLGPFRIKAGEFSVTQGRNKKRKMTVDTDVSKSLDCTDAQNN